MFWPTIWTLVLIVVFIRAVRWAWGKDSAERHLTQKMWDEITGLLKKEEK